MIQTKELLIQSLSSMGYVIPANAKFFRFKKDKEDLVGMKVGEYLHSCHIDSSDIHVLLCIERNDEINGHLYDTFVVDVWDMWAKEI